MKSQLEMEMRRECLARDIASAGMWLIIAILITLITPSGLIACYFVAFVSFTTKLMAALFAGLAVYDLVGNKI